MGKRLILVLLLLFPALASAEPERFDGAISLQAAIARVQHAGFEVQFADADALAARAQSATARAGLLPQVALSATTLNSTLQQLGMPVARQTYVSATASVPLFAPSALLASRGAALGELGASAALAEARNEAAFTVIGLYHRAQLAQALTDARTAALTAQQLHLRQTQLRIAAGKTAPYLLTRDRAAAAAAQQMVADAKAQHEQSLNDLKAALNYRMDSNLSLSEPLVVDPRTISQGEAMRRVLTERPAVLAAAREVQAARERLRAAKAAYLPSIAGNLQTYNGSSSPNLGSTGYQIGVTATLPVIDGNRHASVLQAQSDEQRAQTRYDQVALLAERDVANAFSELDAATMNVQTSQTALADAREQLRIARLREDAGKAINLEVLDALSTSASAQETVLVAVARYDNALAAVDHATGTLAHF